MSAVPAGLHAFPKDLKPLTPTHSGAATPTGTSSSLSESSAVSRQSSVRSTASVVAVPIKKAPRGPVKSQPSGAPRSVSPAITRAFDSSNVVEPVASTSALAAAATASPSYFDGQHHDKRRVYESEMSRQSSSAGGSSGGRTPALTYTPKDVHVPSTLTEWSAIGTAVDGIVKGDEGRSPGDEQRTETETRDSRAGSSSSAGTRLSVVRKTISDFQFGQTLGEGSYSTVALVTDKNPPHRQYALKILDKDHIKRERKTKYVLIERDTLKALDGHPGIVRLYWTFQDQSSLYYVLELAKNGELLKWIKKYGSFSPPVAKFYAAQILSAVEHMHKRGVIHRDLKPEKYDPSAFANPIASLTRKFDDSVLLDDHMRVKITDFGTAKLLSSDSQVAEEAGSDAPRSRSFVGTPEYVSPEILSEKKESSFSSDYWGFGCILFQLLAGRPPFQARTEYLMFQKIINLEYEFPLGFPVDAKDLIEKLLVVDPKERLGGGPEGVEDIKSHPFFSNDPAIDWARIWTVEPPEMETGLSEPKAPVKGEFILLNEFDDSGPATEEDDDRRPSGINGRQSTDEGDSALRKSESLESRRFAESDSGLSDHGSKWSGILLPSETITFASPVHVKRGLFNKQRSLILTDHPRLICIKDAPTRVTIKNEIYLGKSLRGGITKPGAVAFVKAEHEGDKVLIIKTSLRSYKFEEPSGGAKRWVKELQEAAAI
ncbi:serine/threonine protein kinase [Microbotryomycetes sp. JL201]|nr:serine/threonine protein kinase [Microbotryomycetes sp. JL201]